MTTSLIMQQVAINLVILVKTSPNLTIQHNILSSHHQTNPKHCHTLFSLYLHNLFTFFSHFFFSLSRFIALFHIFSLSRNKFIFSSQFFFQFFASKTRKNKKSTQQNLFFHTHFFFHIWKWSHLNECAKNFVLMMMKRKKKWGTNAGFKNITQGHCTKFFFYATRFNEKNCNLRRKLDVKKVQLNERKSFKNWEEKFPILWRKFVDWDEKVGTFLRLGGHKAHFWEFLWNFW